MRLLALLTLLPSVGLASSYVEKPKALAPDPHCEIAADFKGELIRGDFVLWSFKAGTPTAVGEITCTELTQDFELFIPGAKPARSVGRIAYPEHIPAVTKNETYRMKVLKREFYDRRAGKKFSEWIVNDWREGFRKARR